MSGSGGISQLLKGLIMGVVLILAIIGSMSMLEKDKVSGNSPNTSRISNTPTTASVNTQNIKAPDINVASQTPNEAINPSQTTTKAIKDNFQPKLEGENNEVEKQAEIVKYGILKLSTINPENNKNLLAGYVVFDSKNIKVAQSNSTSSASYRLPVGNYKVIGTLVLVQSNDATARKSPPVQSTETITISAQKLTDKVFELQPPTKIGVLQVSATNAKNNRAMKANFIIQKGNGESVATRQNVTHSLFKLKAGVYKVTVKSGSNSDFRTVVVEPGESVTEVFKLQEAFLQGKLLVRVIDINTNNPVQADMEISTSNGQIIQALKTVSQIEIALAAGSYKIKVIGSKGESTKSIKIVAGQSSNQIFRIDSASTLNNSVQINDNAKISGVGEQQESIVRLLARDEANQKPIKSNFYVQTPAGKHLAKKIYADSAEFNLKPGKYRITVRSNNRKNIVRNIQVSDNQTITEVFSLQRNTAAPNNNQASSPATVVTKPIPKPTAVANGFLNVAMQPAKNTHFIIANQKGRKIVELTSVPSGNFKLDTGIYIVTAIFNGQRRKQTIQVHQGKTSRLRFNANDFQKKPAPNKAVQKGSLRSRIVDREGRPLRGNLTVKNLRGQIVAQANNVTFGVFNLPAVPHVISVNYQGISGSEQVKITAGETTVQTFTIIPNNGAAKPPAQQPPRDAKDILREKLKEELRRIF